MWHLLVASCRARAAGAPPFRRGPIARTGADAALALDVMAEPSAADLYGRRTSCSLFPPRSRTRPRPLLVVVWDDAWLATRTHDVLAALARTEALLSCSVTRLGRSH